MAKKSKTDDSANAQRKPAEDYYRLKTDAVHRLVNAEKKTYDNTKEDPGKEYRSGFLTKLPDGFKALFMKFWFYGAVCFFIFWGLGMYVTDMLDMIVIMAIVLGMVTDLLVNNAFRFLERHKGQNSRWMMFPQRKYWTFFANIGYAFAVLMGVIWLYNVVNLIANSLKGTEGVLYIGVEPILFGLFYLLVDMCLIGIKNTFIKVINDAKRKNAR